MDEDFCRHARNELDANETREFRILHCNARGVVVRPGLGVFRDVCGDATDGTFELRCGLLIEGRQSNNCRLTDVDLVDVLRLNFCLDREGVGFPER